jgi:hypothetical protein
VRRIVAIVLGVALISTVGQASALHTHVYGDHDHQEHHHGLAVHDHHSETTDLAEADTPRLASCDPARHAVTLVWGCADCASRSPAVSAYDTPAVLHAPVRSHTAIATTDVRVHGPPPPGQTLSRAPPVSNPA